MLKIGKIWLPVGWYLKFILGHKPAAANITTYVNTGQGEKCATKQIKHRSCDLNWDS